MFMESTRTSEAKPQTCICIHLEMHFSTSAPEPIRMDSRGPFGMSAYLDFLTEKQKGVKHVLVTGSGQGSLQPRGAPLLCSITSGLWSQLAHSVQTPEAFALVTLGLPLERP